MALPRQVEAQLRELEALEKQLAEGQNPAPAEPEPTPAEPPQDPQPAPTETKPVEPTPTPTEPVVAEEKWEQKYKTLKGMYDAEVPRLHSQVKELTQRMDALQKAAEAPKPEAKPAVAE